MQFVFIIAMMFLGITAAQGQTVQLNGQTNSSAAGAAGSASGTSPQTPLLLPGEIPGTSTQAPSTTANAPSVPSPICPPPIPSTDGGSVNLTDIAGGSLNGC